MRLARTSARATRTLPTAPNVTLIADLRMLWCRDSAGEQRRVTCSNAVLGSSTAHAHRPDLVGAPHILYMKRSIGQNGTQPMATRTLTGPVGLLLLAGMGDIANCSADVK